MLVCIRNRLCLLLSSCLNWPVRDSFCATSVMSVKIHCPHSGKSLVWVHMRLQQSELKCQIT